MKKRTYTTLAFTISFLLFALLFFVRNKEFLKYPISITTKSEYVAIEQGESCLHCHQNMKGFSSYHNPDLIGCTGCHLGNAMSLDKKTSHQGMVLIPGNLSDAKQTCGKCHANELHKIENSLMTTNSGLVAVDKFVFGESDDLNHHYHIKDIQDSASDKHLRDLCANCHLGTQKREFGKINQLSRGGGCNACHLNYSKEAERDLEIYLSSDKTELPEHHPSADIFVNDTHCFGCHSRSSRISTNYMGLQETLLDEGEVRFNGEFTVMEDKRVYKKLQEDVHHSKGMLCVDCHSSHEVMGTGDLYAHAEDAVTLQCSDCHFSGKPNTVSYDSLDVESKLVFLHRGYEHTDKEILTAKKDGHPLVNTYVDSIGNAFLISKKDGSLHKLSQQPTICSRDNAHENVSCSACHSSWTSRCIGCHNEFDPDETKGFDLLDKKNIVGQWKEYVAEFSSSKPALGIREHGVKTVVEPAIPGMILTIDKGSFVGHPDTDVSFHRLYAPNSPHTTTKEVRDCKSCHANSAALGYGNGELVYEVESKKGKWVFKPEYESNPNDNLPEDAWIPFLIKVNDSVINSTRTNFRPFNVEEQKRILLVGTCLQCHKDDSKEMQQTLEFGLLKSLKNISDSCILPE